MIVRLVGPALLVLAFVSCSHPEESLLVPVPGSEADPDAGQTGAELPDAGLPVDAGTFAPLAINAGGWDEPPFVPDQGFTGGLTVTNWSGDIDTAGMPNAAPAAVYQTERYGEMAYTFEGLTPGATYSVRLHFCENYLSGPGARLFHVAINGVRVLESYDVFASAGAAHRANVRLFSAIADGNGRITIGFNSVVNNALINGLELF